MLRTAFLFAAFAAAAAAPYNTIAETLITPNGVPASDKFDMAEAADGGFVLLWRLSSAPYTLYAQRHDSAGAVLDSPPVTVTSGYECDNVAVAGLQNGGFVAVWTASGVTHVSVYSSSASLVKTFTVSKATSPYATANADVTGMAAGTFVVTWEEQATAGAGWGIYVQTFSAVGVASSVLQVSDGIPTTATRNYFPVISYVSTSYVISWTDSNVVYAKYGTATSLQSVITVASVTLASNFSRIASKTANWFTDNIICTYVANMTTYYQLYLRDINADDTYNVENSLETTFFRNDVCGFKASGKRGYLAVYSSPYGVRGMAYNVWGSVDDIFQISHTYSQSSNMIRVVGLGGADFDAGIITQTTVDGVTSLVFTLLTDATFTEYSISL